MSFSMWFALAVFLAAMLMIASKRFHKGVVAIAGGAISMIAGLTSPAPGLSSSEWAIQRVDWKSIFLLVGMMIIVGVVKRTGVFQFIAIRAAKAVKGNPIGILIVSSFIAAVVSMFFGPVSTMVAFAPVSILIAIELGISPLPFLISQTLSANVGGITTIVGDPVSVLIGTASQLSFASFLANNGLVGLIIVSVSILILMAAFRGQLWISNERRARIMDFDESRSIQDKGMLIKSVVVGVLVIGGLATAPLTGVEPAIVVLTGAVLLLVLAMPSRLDDVLHEIDWGNILFIVGLFIMVYGLDVQSVLFVFVSWLLQIAGSDLLTISLIVLWGSAIAAALVGTLPIVVVLIPVVDALGYSFGAETVAPLWWAMSLGAALGGNATVFGGAANLAIASISAKSGHPITFATFGRYASPIAVVGLIIASAYIAVRYFVLKF